MTKIRCAIYVRISEEDRIKKELTSLENQEIYARDFIAEHENWVALEKIYCDDGYTGGNTKRPALRALLKDVEAGRIYNIIVYKYERLTRAPADYFFMSSVFQPHNVSVISVTEHFDITTPDGEFMMNNKMALAQYERSMTRDRVKRKIATSRKLGIWTGGTLPPGFKTVDRKLMTDEILAPFIRFMFKRFVETSSQTVVAKELNTKAALELSEGEAQRLKLFNKIRVALLLKNPMYKGYISQDGTLYKGKHEAIVEEALWDQVHDILRQSPLKAPPERHPFDFALTSRIRCQECNKAMVATLGKCKHKKYQYYTCLNKNKGMNCKGLDMNIDSELVFRLVSAEVRKILKEPELLGGLWHQLSQDSSPEEAYKRLQNLDKAWDLLVSEEKNKILQQCIKTVWLGKQGITLEWAPKGEDVNAETSKIVTIPGSFYNRGSKSQVFVRKEEPVDLKDPVILKALVQAELWQKKIDVGEYSTNEEVAQAYGCDKEYVQRGLFLAALSPRIKSAIIRGKLSPKWTLQDFKRKRPSLDWREQEAAFLEQASFTKRTPQTP